MGTSYEDLIAGNVRALRARANLSQEQVADRMYYLGFATWSHHKVSKTERAVSPVAAGDLLGLAVTLECTLAELVGSATPPADEIEFPAGYKVNGLMVQHSAQGWNERNVIWQPDGTARIWLAGPARTVPLGGSGTLSTG